MQIYLQVSKSLMSSRSHINTTTSLNYKALNKCVKNFIACRYFINLFCDVRVHSVICLPLILSCVDIKTCTSPKVVTIIFTLNATCSCNKRQKIFWDVFIYFLWTIPHPATSIDGMLLWHRLRLVFPHQFRVLPNLIIDTWLPHKMAKNKNKNSLTFTWYFFPESKLLLSFGLKLWCTLMILIDSWIWTSCSSFSWVRAVKSFLFFGLCLMNDESEEVYNP